MDARARALTVERDGAVFMRFEGGRCAALRSEDGRHTCAIYAVRPDACRWLERGSGVCCDIISAARSPG
jgi:Fe-S-cluster containining protein